MCKTIGIIGLDFEEYTESILNEIKALEDEIALIGISDSDENQLLKFQKSWGIKKLFTDYEDLIESELPDILYISKSIINIKAIILLAIENKIKGIILNSPIFSDFEVSKQIVDLCRLNNIVLIIDHPKRRESVYKKTKEIFDKKILGEPKIITGNINNNYLFDRNSGCLLYEGLDIIDLIRYFLGEVNNINGFLKRKNKEFNAETEFQAVLNLFSGVRCIITGNGISNYNIFELDIFFERGRIIIGKGIRDYFIIDDKNELIKSDFPTIEDEAKTGSVKEIIQCLKRGDSPELSGFNYIKNLEIAMGIYYSAYLKGNTINLPLKIAGNPLQKMIQSGML